MTCRTWEAAPSIERGPFVAHTRPEASDVKRPAVTGTDGRRQDLAPPPTPPEAAALRRSATERHARLRAHFVGLTTRDGA